MTSLSDIPTEYLDGNHKTDFIEWLHDLPVESHVRRNLVYFFSRYTETDFTPREMELCLEGSLNNNGKSK